MSLRLIYVLLWSASILGLLLPQAKAQPSNGITREVYLNIAGGSIPDLTNNPAFPNSPSLEEILTTSMDCPVDVYENYGTRLRALILPPTTGNYLFWISGDDNCQLFLSTDATPANRVLIARVNTWTSWKEWTKETNQQSAPIPLVGGQTYYLEALHKEGGGGDSLSVRWQLPGGTIEEPLPASRCRPVGVTAPVFLSQPTNLTVVEGNSASFSVAITHSFGAVLQWQRNGTNIPGATSTNYTLSPVSLSDSGSVFRCVAVNTYGPTNSTNATLRVLADVTPPTISAVGNLGDNDLISVVFSEPVEAASATASGNYGINNGVSVLAASAGVDNRTVVLTTTPMAVNVTYTLTVNNVRDRAVVPNTILPNSQRTFSINPRPLDISFLKPPAELPGPATRRGPLVISEVMYHPTNRFDARNVEFVEIYNSQPWFEEMGGFKISGAVDYTFPSNFVLGARSYVVVAAVPADVQAVYGLTSVLGPWTGALQNGNGTLRLRNARDAILFEMDYTGDAPYPAAADGAGHSLVLARPSYGERDPRAWAASDVIGGRPGTNEVVSANPLSSVMINEFLAHTDPPDLDYIELYNYSASSLSLAGCVLTDDPATNKFVIPAGTTIPGGGFKVFYETNLGFALSAAGETIFLKNPQNTRVLDAVRFEGQENGVATGRYPDGGPSFSRLQDKTPGASNPRIRTPSVVINEVMFHPVTDNDADEFIELFNPTTNAINVSKWRIKDGVKFTIPNGTIIPANGYLVLAANAARLRTNYAGLTAANCLGDWEGTLRNSGERVALTMPDQIIGTNSLGLLVTNTIHIVMDEVTYANGGRWGQWADGGGSSLELRDWRSHHRLAPSWADSVETAKSGWVTVETTGVMDNGYADANQLHITLMGAGECLVDNVEVIPSNTGVNALANGNFESGTAGWVFQGNHNQTSGESGEGFSSARSLHLRATGRGDTGANRVRAQLPSTLSSGTTVTLRAKVRWLKGNPNILLRLRGNWLEAPGATLTAKNLGTPGAVNSTAVTNAAPAITDVAHWPPLPAASQPVLVTTRVQDPDGVSTLLLKYRIDPSTNLTAVSMTNNGAGLFSAVLPAQAAGVQAAFHIQSSDKINPALASTFPQDAPRRECLVRWGDNTIPGTLPTYRFWVSQANVNRWSSEEKMSNDPKDITFIYGTNRIAYNSGGWYHGSPYHSPGYDSPVGGSCDYDLRFAEDERLFGETDINLFRPGNGGGDGTAQAEVQGYWFGAQFGIPFLYHRPVFVFVNGLRRETVYHDAQQPNGDFVDQWFPDDAAGELHKIQIGFEFGDLAYGASEPGFGGVGADLNRYTTTGGAFKQARYRQTWPLRSTSPWEQNDYTNLFALVNKVLTSAPINSDAYTATLTNAVDVEEWYKVHVAQHLFVNGDSFSYGGGQNAFTYKPERDGWKLFLWDIDFAFGGNASDANLFGIGGAEHGPRNDHAPFRRIYWQALIEAANGFMSATRSNPILDARYNGMLAAGASVGSPQGIKDFIATRRSLILSQVAANQAPFAITSNNGADFTTAQNLITLTGTAPLEVRTIEVNGLASILTWTSVTTWSLRVALPAGTNALSIVGYDPFGKRVTNASDTITVNVTAPLASPQDFIAINEIMFRPLVPDAEYVELFNSSINAAFDLSNWRLDGVDYAFPEGTILAPRGFIVLAKDRLAFATAYGTNVVPFGVFNGNLQSNGETLTLVKPGLTAATDVVIDKVRYEGALPWPYGLPGTAAAVQLIDARQDNSRVGNWSGLSPSSTNVQWRFASMTATASGSGSSQQLMVYLNEPGDAYLDDLYLVTGTAPAVGPNLIRNGDFESALYETPGVTNSWVVGTNYTNSAISTDVKHSGNSSLHLVCSKYSNLTNLVIYQSLSPYPSNQQATLSFWYLPTLNATGLYVRIRNTTLGTNNLNIQPVTSGGPARFTPGTNNSTTLNLPAFPTLWINEVQADNLSGLTDSVGDRDPWVELHNVGTNAVSLNGLFLAVGYTNLTQWAFPTGVVMNPGEFKIIFADGETNESVGAELHTNFRLPGGSGSLALSRLFNGEPQVLDYVNYTAGLDHSYGSFPDGQPFSRQEFYFVTPAGTNNGTLPPVVVSINEWMADNVGAFADPADNNFEDWFELYNPGSNAVSLAGYFLTDTLTNKFKFEIPPGYSIPPRGYLLVWADNESNQNQPTNADLHVNFSLAKGGEALGLFTPDGLQIDAVTFGPQVSDVGMGRFPDGSASILPLTNYTPRAANYIAQLNVAPILTAPSSRTIAEGQFLSFKAIATDGNVPAQPLTWSLDPGAPPFAQIDAASGLFTWQPGELEGGSNYTITIRVMDNGNPPLTDAKTFDVTVLKTNSLPTLVTSGNKTVNEGALLSFTVAAGDSDLPAQVLTFSLDSAGLPDGASIDPNSGVFNWTPTEAQGPGFYNFTIRVTDNGVPPLSEAALITIAVNESNTPPVLTALSNLTARIGETVSFTAHAADSDLPPQLVTFDFLGSVPAGATIHALKGDFSWVANEVGTNTFTIRATDHSLPNLSDTKTFDVIVTAPLQITTITLSNEVVTLNWTTLPGRSYSVDYKNSLNETAWTPFATNLTATNSNHAITDTVTNAQRIYRIVLQP